MIDRPITDSANVHQRIRRWSREIVAAAVITVAAVAFLAAANWHMNAARVAKPPSKPAMTLADKHPPP